MVSPPRLGSNPTILLRIVFIANSYFLNGKPQRNFEGGEFFRLFLTVTLYLIYLSIYSSIISIFSRLTTFQQENRAAAAAAERLPDRFSGASSPPVSGSKSIVPTRERSPDDTSAHQPPHLMQNPLSQLLFHFPFHVKPLFHQQFKFNLSNSGLDSIL